MKFLIILGFLVSLTSTLALTAPDVNNTTVAENDKVVILVSDNPADNMTVNNIAHAINNSVIIHTPWGGYNQTIVSKILAENPNMVLIVGGPMAVPEKYEEALDDLNISVERIYGEDRYETNEKVFEWVKHHFKHALKYKKVIVIHGLEDINADIDDDDAVIILSNGNNLSVNESELKEINATGVVVVSGAFIDNNTLVVKRLENHGFYVSTHAIKEDTLKHVVENKYRNLNVKVKLSGNDELIDELTEIKELIDESEYREAYKLEIEFDEKLKIQNKLKINKKIKLHVHKKGNNETEYEIKYEKELKDKELEIEKEKEEKDDEKDDENEVESNTSASITISNDSVEYNCEQQTDNGNNETELNIECNVSSKISINNS
jgi:putative cell wall-binding protein